MEEVLRPHDAVLRTVHGIEHRPVNEILLFKGHGVAGVEVSALSSRPMALSAIRINIRPDASDQRLHGICDAVSFRIGAELRFAVRRGENSEMPERAQLVV